MPKSISLNIIIYSRHVKLKKEKSWKANKFTYLDTKLMCKILYEKYFF
jgi:hypothetical protein